MAVSPGRAVTGPAHGRSTREDQDDRRAAQTAPCHNCAAELLCEGIDNLRSTPRRWAVRQCSIIPDAAHHTVGVGNAFDLDVAAPSGKGVFGGVSHQLEEYETNVPALRGRKIEWSFDQGQVDTIVNQARKTERAAQIAHIAR